MEYLIINIKNPELGPQPVHPSVWNDTVTLKDMGYMRYESVDNLMNIVQPESQVTSVNIPFIEQAVKTANDQYTTRKRKK